MNKRQDFSYTGDTGEWDSHISKNTFKTENMRSKLQPLKFCNVLVKFTGVDRVEFEVERAYGIHWW